MTTESTTPWHDYLLHRGSTDGGVAHEILLRETLAQACPGCSQHLADAERELAALSLALTPVPPPSALRDRVLARIAVEDAGSGRLREPAPRLDVAPGLQHRFGPGRGRPSLSSLPGAYRVGRWVVTSALVAVVVLVGALLVRIEGRTAALDGRIDRLLIGQERTASGLETVAADLQQRQNGTSSAELGALDRQLRDLRMVLASVPTVTPAELTALRAEGDVLAAENLVALAFHSVADEHAVMRLFWDRHGGRMLLAGTGLAALSTEQNYVLWLRAHDGSRINGGIIAPDTEGGVRALITIDKRIDLSGLEISVEASSGPMSATADVRYRATVE